MDACNISYASNAGSAIIPDIMSSGSTPAFSAAAGVTNTTPGGDDFPKYNGNYVATVNALLNNTANQNTMLTFSRTATAPNVTGYAGNGYTQGPNYWGKTFYMWPPDPRGTDLDANNTSNHANNGASTGGSASSSRRTSPPASCTGSTTTTSCSTRSGRR